MEELQQRHRKEQRDLQSRITQEKKASTKKSRKIVNDECVRLETDLKEKQAVELAQFNGEALPGDGLSNDVDPSKASAHDISHEVQQKMQSISVAASQAPDGEVKKPNRQKARLARRAAEQEAAKEQAELEAADLPNLRDKEISSMREAYRAKGLTEHDIRSDGHCLYAAVADQLKDTELGLIPSIEIDFDDRDKPDYLVARHVAAAYIGQNADDFVPFLEQPMEDYIRTIRETGEWGGHLEILALAKAYMVDINVLHGDGHVDNISSGEDKHGPLWLAYYRHTYGLGEHYNSLRRSK